MPLKALITCNALAHILCPLAESDLEVRVLDIGLHVSPDRLRAKLLTEVAAVEQAGMDILLGYGLCGRGTEGVVSQSSRLILPRVDDCVGALLGSRTRHLEILKKCPGCFFMEPHWLDTELNIFEEISKGMGHIPIERRERIIKMALKHYNTLTFLTEGLETTAAWNQCERYSSAYNLHLMHLPADHALLRKLIQGPWDSEDFVVVGAGEPIPLF